MMTFLKSSIRRRTVRPGVWLAVVAMTSVPVGGLAAERQKLGNVVLENVPTVRPETAERTRQYQNTRSAQMQAWEPGGSVLVTTRFGNTAQVHRVLKPGGARTQLTFLDEPVADVSTSPDPSYRGFLYSRDSGGGEFYQYYWFDGATGRSTLISDGKSRNSGARWSNRGDRFVYMSTRRNGRDYDLFQVSMASPALSKLVKEFTGSWGPGDWSPDDTKLLISQRVSVNESTLYVLDLATGELTQINPKPKGAEPISYIGARWSADGRGLYLVSDEGTEFATLRYFDLASGRQEILTPSIAWDLEGLAQSPDRSTLAFAANDNGRSSLYLMDVATRRITPVSSLPLGVIGGLEFSPDGNRLGFTLSTAQIPGDVFTVTVPDLSVERWTTGETGGIDPATFAVPSLVAFPTFDDVSPGQKRMIPAIYYRPTTAAAGRKLPVLINIHGGPEGQSKVSFNPLTQYYVNELGMAVLFPNVRGSTGYGKTYVQLDNGYKREDSVKDIGALLDWIAQQPELDASKVVVYGGSYGGYMVLASMTHYNDRLAAGIDVVGISNWVTFLNNTQDYRRDLRRVEYGDERDPDMKTFLQKISPMTNAAKISKPMLIAQGYNDPRVPVTEAEQMVAELKKNGGAPAYFLAMDEGHGFRKKANVDLFQNVMIEFLEKEVLQR